MKNASFQGASLSHRYLHAICVAALIMIVSGCKKDKEEHAVIEEVPTTAMAETDTSATLAEEPSLQQVGKNGKDAKPGSAKNTFHPNASPSADQAGFSDAGHYVVQVAVFKSKRQAAALVEKLANSGYPAYVSEVENPVPELAGTYHRVRIGKFLRIPDAKSFGDNTLKPMGYDFWVDNKKNDAVGGDGSGYSAPAPEAAPAPAETPVSAKSKVVPEVPSEPAVPSGDTWGTPKTEAPAAPASETSSAPKASVPATTSSTPSTPASSAPAKTPSDTGKVNLDEW